MGIDLSLAIFSQIHSGLTHRENENQQIKLGFKQVQKVKYD